jgi:hypothetical protein
VVLHVRGKDKFRDLVAAGNVAEYLERVRAEGRATKLDDFVFTTDKGKPASTLYESLIERHPRRTYLFGAIRHELARARNEVPRALSKLRHRARERSLSSAPKTDARTLGGADDPLRTVGFRAAVFALAADRKRSSARTEEASARRY